MERKRILVVEDDETIAEVLKEYLENSNFEVSILTHGNKVLSHIKNDPISLILLDIMLPDEDGIAICSKIRSFSRVPIIMVTAKVGEIDRLIGLEIGADDYICKPFAPREVVARVKAVLRRTVPEEDSKLVIGSLVMEKKKHVVTIDGSVIDLTPMEYQILEILMSNPDQVFSRNDFIKKILGYSYDGYDRTIDNHIKNLRKKINTCIGNKKIIHTIYGLGYKIVSPSI